MPWHEAEGGGRKNPPQGLMLLCIDRCLTRALHRWRRLALPAQRSSSPARRDMQRYGRRAASPRGPASLAAYRPMIRKVVESLLQERLADLAPVLANLDMNSSSPRRPGSHDENRQPHQPHKQSSSGRHVSYQDSSSREVAEQRHQLALATARLVLSRLLALYHRLQVSVPVMTGRLGPALSDPCCRLSPCSGPCGAEGLAPVEAGGREAPRVCGTAVRKVQFSQQSFGGQALTTPA